MKQKIAVVFGGTGFVGRQIVRELAAKGIQVRVATRITESAYFLRTCGDVGQIVPWGCDYSDYDDIARAVEGVDYVVNCVGILYERGKKRSFARVHVQLAESIAAAASVAGVARLVQISALGVDVCRSKYAQSKLAGEKAVLAAFDKATILRPSLIFGPDDDFFNKFASLAQSLPALPLIGGGKTKFQPVYVGDVADAVIEALCGSAKHQGKIYELGGPETLSFKEVYERIFAQTRKKRALVYLPFWVAKVEAAFLSLLPVPLLTGDQVESLKYDSVVGSKAKSLENLGIRATALDVVLPTYLQRYRDGGKFADGN